MQLVLEVIITSGGVKNNPWLHVILQPCHPDPGLHFLKITEWVAKHVNKKWQSSDVFFRLLFYSKLDFRRLPSVRSFILPEERLFRGMSYKVTRSDLTDRLTHLGRYLTYQANVMKLKWEII